MTFFSLSSDLCRFSKEGFFFDLKEADGVTPLERLRVRLTLGRRSLLVLYSCCFIFSSSILTCSISMSSVSDIKLYMHLLGICLRVL